MIGDDGLTGPTRDVARSAADLYWTIRREGYAPHVDRLVETFHSGWDAALVDVATPEIIELADRLGIE